LHLNNFRCSDQRHFCYKANRKGIERNV
jgi:hypothetical protein